MPLSRRIARFNKQYTNRVLWPLVQRLPGFALVVHQGRKSGQHYTTPILVFARPGGYRIALTYGPTTDWVRNVLAAGGCSLRIRGQRVVCAQPHLGNDPTNGWVPLPARLVLRRAGVADYLELTTVPTTADTAQSP